MRSAIHGCRKSASFLAVLSSILGSAACSESAASPPLYSVVDGTWSTDCITRQDLFTSYRIELALANAQDVTRRESYFADAHCSEPLAFLEYQGLYELIVTSRDFIYAMDLIYESQALEPLNAEGQAKLEAAAFCGRQQWPLAEAQYPLSFDPGNCTAVGPVPLKNLNLLRVHRGFSLEFGVDIAHENERPVEIVSAPQLVFLSQPLP